MGKKTKAKPPPPATGEELSPFERLRQLTRAVVAVPKDEVAKLKPQRGGRTKTPLRTTQQGL